MLIKETIWCSTNDGTIGIVLGEDSVTHAHKAYIGIGRGFDEDADTKHISELGSPLPEGLIKRVSDFLTGAKK